MSTRILIALEFPPFWFDIKETRSTSRKRVRLFRKDGFHNMIRKHGAHTETEIQKWDLSYDKLGKLFDNRLVKPRWYDKKYPGVDFSPQDYLIRGNPDKKASNPTFVARIINSVLGKCSHIRLLGESETASWVCILRSDAEDGSYVVFFKVQALKR